MPVNRNVFAHAEEAAEAQDRVGDLTAFLVDHHPLDLADPPMPLRSASPTMPDAVPPAVPL